jgi:gamma-glutamyl:cysteine ligase YbdK (ATP-grasp superfamily)
MGQDVEQTRFDRHDFQRFEQRLQAETELLHSYVEQDALSRHAPVAGLELEAWLIDEEGRPAPRNDEFIARMGSPEIVTEIGRFNVELNVPPRTVAGEGLVRLAADLESTWQRCGEVADSMGLQAVAIGILPTVRDADLTLANLSDRARYRALNQQVLRQRHGRPIRLEIESPLNGEALRSEHLDVMLEAAATSFQVHLQVPAAETVRAYNAALVASAPLVALSANSPLLFGKQLWQETRIALFEQALNIGAREDGAHPPLARVGFGSGYAGYSLVECFRENADRFEPLLPVEIEGQAAEMLPHLRLHNGTIWRWNRPLVGFDAKDGRMHLRVEHRPMAAGPSLPDMMANLAFAIGVVADLARDPVAPESRLPFAVAEANFYAAARHGLDAPLRWLDGSEMRAGALLASLVDRARAGLAALGVDAAAAARWMALIEARLAARATGARWQLERLSALGGDLSALTLDYARRQRTGEPVHRWFSRD